MTLPTPPVDPRPGWARRPTSLPLRLAARAEYACAAHIGHTAGSAWAIPTMRTTSRSAERHPERTAAPR
ncbi:hypothetical protein [Nocardioides sediminis]|uniref:hypothetical protein n=1 Tax=Nocardioides sediminis TaxID=433648 RepID=UPI00131F30F5|nr:hypothetical protein [Nocardioides sediminis]